MLFRLLVVAPLLVHCTCLDWVDYDYWLEFILQLHDQYDHYDLYPVPMYFVCILLYGSCCHGVGILVL